MYCGICIEVCPFDALFWSPEFEYSTYSIRELTHEKDQLRVWMDTVPPPPELEREIPPIRIAMHGYTPVARDRLVMIDGALLREGEAVAPGLRLEEITPDGVVLGYKGYRFHRSVR
jgi:ferredoxin